MNEYITNRVHDLYWKEDINCARTALVCLSELFEITIEPQTIWSAVGLHGAGGYRAQCGLVEGSLMFIGIYLYGLGKPEDEIVSACYNFASAFEKAFGSLRTCIHNRLTPSGQVFSRPAALKNLAIHQVLLRFFALQGGKIPCPACIIRL